MVGRMSGRGHAAGTMYSQGSLRREVSGRGGIRRGTSLREDVSLGSIHEEVSIGEL